MDRRHRAIVAGVHRLKHVERFGAAYLAEDDAVGAHAQSIAQQVAHGDLAGAFEVRRAGLQPHDMRLLQLQFGRILDRHGALDRIDQSRQGVEQSRLAGTGAAGNQDVEPAAGGDLQKRRHLWRNVCLLRHRIEGDRLLREFPDRNARSVDCQRRRNDVDATAVGETGVDERLRFIDASPDPGHDLCRDVHDMLVVAKPYVGQLELAAALDIDLPWSVDHDVGDRVVLDQRFERPEPEHVGDQYFDELALLDEIQLDLALGQQILDPAAKLRFEHRARHLRGRGYIHVFEDEGLNLRLRRFDRSTVGAPRHHPVLRQFRFSGAEKTVDDVSDKIAAIERVRVDAVPYHVSLCRRVDDLGELAAAEEASAFRADLRA